MQSPPTNLKDDLDSRHRNCKRDLILPIENLNELLVELYLPKGTPLNDPRVSPLFGDYTGFPPMMVTVDESEVLFDDSELLVKKAREAGVEVLYEVQKGTFHTFPALGTICPESKAIMKQTVEFVHKHC